MKNTFLKVLVATAFVLLMNGCDKGEKQLNSSGTLEATEVDIAPLLAGRVLRVGPALGDNVTAGDTLVVLDIELLSLQRVQAESNRKTLAAQKLVVRDGLEQARQNLELLETNYSRTKTLFDVGTATQQSLDEITTKRDVAAIQVQTAHHQIAALDAEDDKLSSTLAVFDRQLRDGVVLAPQRGTIILRSVEPGEIAAPGSVMLRLADLNELELRVFLGEQELSKVTLGQRLPVLVDALPGETRAGVVSWISSEAEFTPKNAQTRTARTQLVYAVKLRVANPDGKLHIGMPAEVKL